jgi:hypothetical protein
LTNVDSGTCAGGGCNNGTLSVTLCNLHVFLYVGVDK